MKKPLIENLDFYYNEAGFIVLTEKFHLEKGFCCGNGCLHCPYDYIHVEEPKRSQLLVQKASRDGSAKEKKSTEE